MPNPLPLRKRLIPASTAFLPDEVDEVQNAAHSKRMSMSQFVRGAAVKEANRVLRRFERLNGRALEKTG